MDPLAWTILCTFLVSLIAFVGMLSLTIKEKLLNKILVLLVALSAGSLMGGAFLHLIPESLDLAGAGHDVFSYTIIGFVSFFLVEKLLYWRHCHKGKCYVHSFAYMNLFGDAVHNFIDGLIIAASFVTNLSLGVVTTFAIALHEVPQEIGDFGVLVYAGFGKSRALVLNFLAAISVVAGGVFGFFLSDFVKSSVPFLLPFAAGGFIYVGASDLIPEIKEEKDLKKSLSSFFVFLVGILIMFLVKFI